MHSCKQMSCSLSHTALPVDPSCLVALSINLRLISPSSTKVSHFGARMACLLRASHPACFCVPISHLTLWLLFLPLPEAVCPPRDAWHKPRQLFPPFFTRCGLSLSKSGHSDSHVKLLIPCFARCVHAFHQEALSGSRAGAEGTCRS